MSLFFKTEQFQGMKNDTVSQEMLKRLRYIESQLGTDSEPDLVVLPLKSVEKEEIKRKTLKIIIIRRKKWYKQNFLPS